MEKQLTQQKSQFHQKPIIIEKDIKILICQINPFHKNAKNSIDRVQRSLKKYDHKSNIDIVMFPEMSFIGYNYSSVQDALPYANKQMQGQQFQFIIQLAKTLKSYVGFAYIQKSVSYKQGEQGQVTLYNSVAIINRKGQMALNYRKTHLFYNDKFWAKEGEGFKTFQLQNKSGKLFKCTPAICMDINPKQFTSGQYQLADFMIKTQSQVLLMFTNWVDSSTDKVQKSHVKATYQYWVSRLMPLINTPKQRLLVFCDRVGTEQDVFVKKKIMFYGSSCALMINPTYMIKNLDIESQGYLMIQSKMPEITKINKKQ